MSKRGDGGLPSDSSKFEKIRPSSRGNHAKMGSPERLSGGADAQEKSVEDTNPEVSPTDPETEETQPEIEKVVDAVPLESNNHVERIEGEKTVNEMIDYVLQNLHEAGKALASLGENFEHDLKLMFVDVMAKVQNWVSLAQIRIGEAKADLDKLRKELAARSNELEARNREVAELKNKLVESEISKVAFEKALAEKSTGALQSPSAMTFVPSRQPMPTDPSSRSMMGQDDAGVLPAEQSGALSAAQSGLQSGVPSGMQSGVPSGIQSGVPSGMQSGVPSGIHTGGPSGIQSGVPSGIQSGVPSGIPSGIASGFDQRSMGQYDPSGSALDQSYGQVGPSQHGLPYDQQPRSGRGFRASGQPSTTDVAVQSGKTKERAKRSTDLESELSRLRKENDRITKERMDYENAIQRALLRGISSLNAETLRVLKCSPVACYTPCGPPPSPVNTTETICTSKKTRDNWTPQGCKTSARARPARSRMESNRPSPVALQRDELTSNCCNGRRSAPGNYGSFSRHKKSPMASDPSMVLLLHRADASNICVPPPPIDRPNAHQVRICPGRTKSRKLENTVCVKKLY